MVMEKMRTKLINMEQRKLYRDSKANLAANEQG